MALNVNPTDKSLDTSQTALSNTNSTQPDKAWSQLSKDEKNTIKEAVIARIRADTEHKLRIKALSEETGIPLGTVKLWYLTYLSPEERKVRKSDSSKRPTAQKRRIEIKALLTAEMSRFEQDPNFIPLSSKELAQRYKIATSLAHRYIQEHLSPEQMEKRKKRRYDVDRATADEIDMIRQTIEQQIRDLLEEKIEFLEPMCVLRERFRRAEPTIEQGLHLLSKDLRAIRDVALKLQDIYRRGLERSFIGRYVRQLHSDIEDKGYPIPTDPSLQKNFLRFVALMASREHQIEKLVSFKIHTPMFIGVLSDSITHESRVAHFVVNRCKQTLDLNKRVNVWHAQADELDDPTEHADLVILPPYDLSSVAGLETLDQHLILAVFCLNNPGILLISGQIEDNADLKQTKELLQNRCSELSWYLLRGTQTKFSAEAFKYVNSDSSKTFVLGMISLTSD